MSTNPSWLSLPVFRTMSNPRLQNGGRFCDCFVHGSFESLELGDRNYPPGRHVRTRTHFLMR